MRLTFREMTVADAPAVHRVEEASFRVPWSLESFERAAANPDTLYLLALYGDVVVGFIGCWISLEEAEITNVAVVPERRGEGVATALLGEALMLLNARGVRRVTLEVRPSNTPARALYNRFGFLELGVRKAYYSDGEDAIVMWNTSL